MFSGTKRVNQFCVTPFRHVKLVFTIFFFILFAKYENMKQRAGNLSGIQSLRMRRYLRRTGAQKGKSLVDYLVGESRNTSKNRRKFIKEVVLTEQDSGYVGIFDVIAPLDCVQNFLVYIDFSITIDLNRLTYKLLVNKNPLMKSRSKNHQPQDRKMSLFSKANSRVHKLVLIYQEIRSSWFVFICRGALN